LGGFEVGNGREESIREEKGQDDRRGRACVRLVALV